MLRSGQRVLQDDDLRNAGAAARCEDDQQERRKERKERSIIGRRPTIAVDWTQQGGLSEAFRQG
ncbi:MAG: hypothetical protein C3F14_02485 [Deltaproteobacteria bacterium]|nr:MAG: hypothetical protein C3F14_02485 [Deltaproteobacteria bacterium]